MVFGLGGRDHDSQHQYYLYLGTPNDFKKSKEIPNHLKSGNLRFGKTEILKEKETGNTCADKS